MNKVWELYALAKEIMAKLCKNKCYHYGQDKIEACTDYVADRLERNELQALKNFDDSKGASESTYLHMLVGSRIIDFFNTATHRRETANEDSITHSYQEVAEVTDYAEILDKVIFDLTPKEQTYVKYRFYDELTPKEIAGILGIESKKVSKTLENIQIKLKRRLEKLDYSLKDII